MRDFIEVTRQEDGKKILLNISRIEGVFPESGYSFIASGNDKPLFSHRVSGYYVKETYEEVKELINDSQKIVFEEIKDIDESTE